MNPGRKPSHQYCYIITAQNYSREKPAYLAHPLFAFRVIKIQPGHARIFSRAQTFTNYAILRRLLAKPRNPVVELVVYLANMETMTS
jgi:hypothetical protein